ncbi:DUF5683 domain-containing protein [Mucilaginibacter ginkgonis]|uniref:Uncharacterized protein n=1 Tax=Mucilaginibacter ginkgonis TaxID=2682091 RepID=A0A6I4I2W5_9SPHI|nr:DUF5683 domain-containing protein [Mucilaginibacter ginkgonis]QQL48309.1 hypothetical protein GO620_008880 [Mucilaginibacter ginkgonis]
MRFWLSLITTTLFSINAFAQRPDSAATRSRTDSLTRVKDSISSKPFKPKAKTNKIYTPDSLHDPHKAVMRSLILPGWGQVYNHRIWKVPIIYGGFGALGLAIQYNLHYYNLYIKEAKLRRDTGKPSAELAQYSGGYQQFFDAAASNQRNFQLSILGVVGVWGINCIDAYIDAKFRHSYTVDNNLSFNVVPTVITPPLYAANLTGSVPGVKLTFTLK